MGSRGPKPKFAEYACPNVKCGHYGKTGKGNVVGNGTYQTKNGRVRKLLCRSCGRVFCDRTGTAFYDLRSDIQVFEKLIKMLLKGMSLRGASSTLEIKLDTAREWLLRAASHAEVINDYLVRKLKVSKVELDELWSFIQKKRFRDWQKMRLEMVGYG